MPTNLIPAEPAYVPGVCNINHVEIGRRRTVGYIGAVLFAVVLVGLLALSASNWFRLVLFFPAFMSASGFLQAQQKFCVGYGAAGKQNATEGSASAEAITDKTALSLDKRKTHNINLQSAMIALALTLLTLLLPHS